MRERRIVATCAALTLALGVTACGSDDSDSDSTAASTASTAASTSSTPAADAPKGSPIVVGTIGSYSGPQSASLGAADESIKAWESYTNANGGINGHPVKVIVEDDAGNPTKAAQLVKKLVEQDKVQALVGSASTVTESFQKYITAKKVPVIGSAEFQQDYTSNPLFFPTGTQAVTFDYGLLSEAKKAGVKKFGSMPCAEVAACSLGSKLFEGLGKIVGVETPFVQKITVSQPNYTAACLAAKAKGVDGLSIIQNATTVLRVADQCAQQGYKPKQLNVSATTGQIWQDKPSMEGMIATQSNPVLADTSIPALKTFHTALDQYQPSVAKGDQYNEIDVSVWAGGQTFKLAAERAKLEPTSTPADVLKGLYTFKAETVDGLTPPLTYVKGQPTFTTCWFPQQIKSGKFTPLTQGAKPNCIPDADVPKIVALLKSLG
jgi:branched-chain amino acid transport system substrate-binding protein